MRGVVTVGVFSLLTMANFSAYADEEEIPAPTISFPKGASPDLVTVQLGWPFIRDTQLKEGQSKEVMVYSATGELGVFHFEDRGLIRYEAVPAKAAARTALRPTFNAENGDRAARLLRIEVGAMANEVNHASPPDRVYFKDEAAAQFRDWKVDKVWLYHLQVEQEKQLRAEKRKENFKKFMNGVGEVLGAAAEGIIAAETARREDPGDLIVITNGSAIVVPEGGAVAIGGGKVVQSRIKGEFKGWEGETVVVLENGQVWQQSRYHYEYRYAYRAKVTVVRESGGWVMYVEKMKRGVHVQRLR